MKKLLFVLFVVVSFLRSTAATIDVYSKEIPWISGVVNVEAGKIYSINEAISLAVAGDEIIIHEGIYREKVVVNKNNLTLRNFGTDYVLVSGAELVSGWTDAAGMFPGVKVADISGLTIETPYSQLFADGAWQIMARHPNNTTGEMMEPMDANSGYAPLSNVYKDAGTNATGYATLGGTTLPNVDLTGGIFRGLTGKMRNYVYGTITASSGNTVSFKAINSGVWKNDPAISATQHKFSWGFVMHKNLIDYPGEWYIDNKKVYYLPRATEQMDNIRIEVQVRERVLVLNNTSGVTIEGLNFVAGNTDMQSTSNAVIRKCTMRYLYPFWTPTGYGQGDTDKKGVYLSNSSNNQFTDLYVGHSWGNMFALQGGGGNRFQNCVIEDLGWVGVFTSAIHVSKCTSTDISECTFGDAGRFQIRIDGGDTQINIQDCDFFGAMKMGEDAGPIEATSTGEIGALDLKGSVIAYNRIHDVQGVPVSDGSYKRVKATAMYMEDTENYTAHHNLIYNIKHDKYNGSYPIERVGEFLYMGPRYNAMHKPIKYYNNTVWNVDSHIGIWNIEIDNWKELGITPPDTTGLMENGHFANNIFMYGPHFSMSYVRQILSSTGSNLGYVSLGPESDIETASFSTYTTHCANWGYNFNPQTNLSLDPLSASANFIDAANGNFGLTGTSSAKAAGTEITGITSSSNPDCGAFEGGNRVLNSGSNLEIPAFKEVTGIITAVVEPSIKEDQLLLYPNPASQYLTIEGLEPNLQNLKIEIYSLLGQKVYTEDLEPIGGQITLHVGHLSDGVYLITLDQYPNQRLKFMKD